MFARNALVIAAAAVGLVAAQNGTVVTTTRVVAEYTTYCPEPTTFTFNDKKYVVTEATTLTITDCPCTIVEPCHTCNNIIVPPTGTPVPQPPKPQPNPPKPEPQPPKPVPTDVIAGAARGQALGYFAAAGVAAAGFLAL